MNKWGSKYGTYRPSRTFSFSLFLHLETSYSGINSQPSTGYEPGALNLIVKFDDTLKKRIHTNFLRLFYRKYDERIQSAARFTFLTFSDSSFLSYPLSTQDIQLLAISSWPIMKNTQVPLPLLLDMAIIYASFLESNTTPVLVTRMRFSLGGLQALGLIETVLPRIADGNFSAPTAKLTGQAWYLMTSMMGDTDRDRTDGVDTVKELWPWLSYSQYYVKEWGAESILFQKLFRLRHSDCEGIGKMSENSPDSLNVWPVIWGVFAGIGG